MTLTVNPDPELNAPAHQVTILLRAWRAGDKGALDRLIPLVYDQLRRLAAHQMRQERPDHTLRATALVHDAYLRLAGADVAWEDRAHFLSIAALTIRRILVDHAKSLQRAKRGSGGRKVPLDDSLGDAILLQPSDPERMLDLENALGLLERQDARKAKLLELFYFGGLNAAEAAEVLGVSASTVNRELKMAKAWMRLQLQNAE